MLYWPRGSIGWRSVVKPLVKSRFVRVAAGNDGLRRGGTQAARRRMVRHVPSAGFTRGQSFLILTRSGLKTRIAQFYGEEAVCGRRLPSIWISAAPVPVVACTSELVWPVLCWRRAAGCAGIPDTEARRELLGTLHQVMPV